MNVNACRGCLRNLPLMKALPEHLTDGLGMVLLWVGHQDDILDGTVLYQEGDDKDTTGAVLLTGTVAVKRDGAEETWEVHAPELLGEMQQLTETAQRTATVTAQGDVSVLRFEWHDFVRLAASMFTADEQMQIRDAIAGISNTRSGP